jgi:hypothetical protein
MDLKRYESASIAYQTALTLDPSNDNLKQAYSNANHLKKQKVLTDFSALDAGKSPFSFPHLFVDMMIWMARNIGGRLTEHHASTYSYSMYVCTMIDCLTIAYSPCCCWWWRW